MNEEFIGEIAEFVGLMLEPLDSAERVAAIDHIQDRLSEMRNRDHELAIANARWECEGGAIPPETPDIVLLGSYS